MNKIYAKAEEKYVKQVILYGDTTTKNIYFDEEFHQPVPRDELYDLFLKGFTLKYNGSFMYKPVKYSKGSNSDTYLFIDIEEVANGETTKLNVVALELTSYYNSND